MYTPQVPSRGGVPVQSACWRGQLLRRSRGPGAAATSTADKSRTFLLTTSTTITDIGRLFFRVCSSYSTGRNLASENLPALVAPRLDFFNLVVFEMPRAARQ